MTFHANDFIEFMLSCEVLKFGEFVTKSGRLSPYFVNTAGFKTGSQISRLAGFYAEKIKQTVGANFGALFGPAYKGIPLAASVAAKLFEEHGIDKPYFFNRKEEKDHGEGGSLVGYKPKNGDSIIIIEDVITAGTAIREVMPVLAKSADVSVKGMFISVNRCEVGNDLKTSAAQQIYQEFGITVHSIIDFFDIYNYVKENLPEHISAMDNYKRQFVVK